MVCILKSEGQRPILVLSGMGVQPSITQWSAVMRPIFHRLDVRVLGVAGGSMVRADRTGSLTWDHVQPILLDWIMLYSHRLKNQSTENRFFSPIEGRSG